MLFILGLRIGSEAAKCKRYHSMRAEIEAVSLGGEPPRERLDMDG